MADLNSWQPSHWLLIGDRENWQSAGSKVEMHRQRRGACTALISGQSLLLCCLRACVGVLFVVVKSAVFNDTFLTFFFFTSGECVCLPANLLPCVHIPVAYITTQTCEVRLNTLSTSQRYINGSFNVMFTLSNIDVQTVYQEKENRHSLKTSSLSNQMAV